MNFFPFSLKKTPLIPKVIDITHENLGGPYQNSEKCPICGSTNTKPFESNNNYYRCNTCQSTFVHPIKELEDYLNHKTYLTNPEDYINLIDPKGFIFLLDKFEHEYSKQINRNKGNLLEIGAGVGYFMFMAYARGWNVEGLETSKPSADWANKYLRMDVKNSIIEDFSTTQKYDAIVMIEVLEHLRDPKRSLTKISEISKTPSLIFGTTPNTDSRYWNKDRDIYDPNDHIILFSRKTLQSLFDELKIDLVSIDYFGGDKGDAHLMFSGIMN